MSPSAPTYVVYDSPTGVRSVKVRIDSGVELGDILKQLVGSRQLGLAGEVPSLFCLRTKDEGILVRADNLGSLLESGVSFRLGNSPVIEAAEILEKLEGVDSESRKAAAFSLSRGGILLGEVEFRTAFLERGGRQVLEMLVQDQSISGNTLAYALSTLSILTLYSPSSSTTSSNALIQRVVDIIASEPMVNILRPACQLLSRQMDQEVYKQIRLYDRCLPAIVDRIGATDVSLAKESLDLINAMSRVALKILDHKFGDDLFELGCWKIIARLSEISSDLEARLLFQSNLIASLQLFLSTHVESINLNSAAEVTQGASHLELYCLNRLESTIILRNQSCPFPLARASSDVTKTLVDHFATTILSSPTTLSPLLLHFYELHLLATSGFSRLWSQASAIEEDYDRLLKLLTYHVKSSCSGTISAAKESFTNTNYETIRNKRAKEIAIEGSVLNRAPVRELRSRLYLESFDFMRKQRLECLLRGSWFHSPLLSPAYAPKKSTSSRFDRPAQMYRFYRLSRDFKSLQYLDSSDKRVVEDESDEIFERYDISSINSVLPSARALQASTSRNSTSQRSSIKVSSPLGITLLSASSSTSIELIALDDETYSEWLDGLSLLLVKDGTISTKMTADLIQTLSDVALEARLIDVGNDIPAALVTPALPSIDFYYQSHAPLVK